MFMPVCGTVGTRLPVFTSIQQHFLFGECRRRKQERGQQSQQKNIFHSAATLSKTTCQRTALRPDAVFVGIFSRQSPVIWI
jgi:hypothetical protein